MNKALAIISNVLDLIWLAVIFCNLRKRQRAPGEIVIGRIVTTPVSSSPASRHGEEIV
jgi:hypothetical protein